MHVCRCYRVSAQFEACREAIVEVPDIMKDLCRVLYYKVCRRHLVMILHYCTINRTYHVSTLYQHKLCQHLLLMNGYKTTSFT